jgi:aspartate/glutamate racemase
MPETPAALVELPDPRREVLAAAAAGLPLSPHRIAVLAANEARYAAHETMRSLDARGVRLTDAQVDDLRTRFDAAVRAVLATAAEG